MPLYQAVVLAIVQGLTEFLPVSSTAHLWIVPWILKWNDPGLTFDVALHAGTLVAALLYFWRYWLEMIKMVLGIGAGGDSKLKIQDSKSSAGPMALLGENRQLFWFLVIATIPGGIAGVLFERAAEEKLRSPFIVGPALIIVGLLMWAGERVGSETHDLGKVSLLDSIIVGVAQAFAVIPGVSRSGSTMTAGLFRSMNRETAARFSFLLSTPLIAGACLKKGLEIHHHGLPPDMRLPFLVGVIVSALVGYAVIAVLIRYLERHTFAIFVVYRVILGVVLLAVGWGLRH
ncbi:MAG TPA: undecaprenyl-diphosphate phosphatase [Terriglobia bacterium]|nr:undecaprenyl-diphosphate phosphatase [Terriglobia bacterium]